VTSVARRPVHIPEVRGIWKRAREDRGDIAADLGMAAAVIIALIGTVASLSIAARVGAAAARNDIEDGALQSQLTAFTARPWREITASTNKTVNVTVARTSATVLETVTQDKTTGIWQLTAAVPVVHGSTLKPASCTTELAGKPKPSACLVAVAFNTPSPAEWAPPQPSGFMAGIKAAGVGVQLATLNLSKLGAADATSLRLSVQPTASVSASTAATWAAAAICSDTDVLHVANQSTFVRASNGWLSATVNLSQVAGCTSPTIRLISSSASQPTAAQVSSVHAYRLSGGLS